MNSTLKPVEEEKYSQLAPLAIIALLLGMASALALIHPLFFLIPAAAVGVALLALGKINQSDGALSGAGIARCGLALATIFVAAAFVRTGVRDNLLKEQAAEASKHFVELMTAGKISEIRSQLTGDAAGNLVPRPEPGAEPRPAEELERIALERLQQDPLVRGFAGVDKTQIEVESVSDPVFDGGRTLVEVKLFVADPDSRKHSHVDLQLTRTKFYEAEGRPWRVNHWTADAPHGAH